MVFSRNSRKELLAFSRLLCCLHSLQTPQSCEVSNNKKSKIKYIYKIVSFVIAYIVNSNVIASISLFPCVSNITKMFTELGRLCGHESSIAGLRDVHYWRAFDLLVWNTADTTRKTKCHMKYFLKLQVHIAQEQDVIRQW